MRYLLIAEKPSLMREIRACYQKHEAQVRGAVGEISFIALSGHVCRLAMPDEYEEWADMKWRDVEYPMVPGKWKVLPIEEPSKLNTLRQVRDMAKSHDGIIVATDSDLEGYGVYHLVEEYLGLEDVPTLRFIEHSLTDREILEQLLCMTDFHKDPLHVRWKEAFLIRARADWLFGMNASRIMSVRSGDVMRIGRVKSPTIKLICDNSESIEGFKPEKYFTASADYGSFKAVLTGDDGKPARFASKDIGLFPLEGTVQSVEKKRVTTHAPKLFDLTALQAEAGRAFGYTPEHTLDTVQSLYEKHKVISYPRTQCQYVSAEKAKEFPLMLGLMSAFPDLGAIASSVTAEDIARVSSDRQVVNDREVQKEAHDALLPTSVKPVPSRMTPDEANICRMIYARLLQQFLPEAADDKSSVLIRHGGGLFAASGKMVAEQGWRVLFKEAKDSYLPELKEGQRVEALSITPEKKTTSPPKRLTQATLINSMKHISSGIKDDALRKTLAESQGIGTPSTRAGIISDIISSGYAEDRKDGLHITESGKAYMKALAGRDIASPEFAAVMDDGIKKVQRGEASYGETYGNVLEKLREMCSEMETYRGEPTGMECPRCGGSVMAGKYRYSCTGCSLSVPRTLCGTEIGRETLKALLEDGAAPPMEFVSRAGKPFSARLRLEGEKVAFDFSSGIRCPACGERDVEINRGGAFCRCGFKLYRKEYGAELTDGQLEALLKERSTGRMGLFSAKKNATYEGILYLNDANEVKVRFPDREG